MTQQMTERLVINRFPYKFFQTRDWVLSGSLLLLATVFILKASTFGLLGNLQILGISIATIGIVAAGQTLVVITGGVDLSVGSLVALTGIIAAKLCNMELGTLGRLNPLIAGTLALLIAAGIGWVNGWLITRYRLTPFIVTFGSLSFLTGLSKVISGGSPVNLNIDTFDWMWNNAFNFLPTPTMIMLLVFLVLAFWLRNSRYGRHAYAVGSNETAARLSGVQVDRTRQVAYTISGFLAGVAGLLVMAQIKGGTFGNGQGYELISIAAVIIGGTSLNGGRGSIWGTLAGVLLIPMLKNGLVLFSVPWLWNDMAVGAFIVIAAMIDMERRRTSQYIAPAMPNNAPLPAKEFVLPPAHSLDQALNRLSEMVTQKIGQSQMRVFLFDHDEWNNLRRLDQGAITVNDAIQQAYLTSKATLTGNTMVLPLIRQGETIGVVEVEAATNPNQKMVDGLSHLITPISSDLEDLWRLESGWLSREVREGLRHLSDESKLEKSELADWFLPPGQIHQRGTTMKRCLAEALDYLAPPEGDAASRASRRHQILHKTYVEQKNVEAIVLELGLSRRQYFYDLKEAVDDTAHHLFSVKRAG